mmetsp:Transcript_35622/g.113882  ORF Transcript_35622/g.113882 Transcript_35622/m.113882 type:complete len:590 (+) Transcript_35622:410-2179(+)
MERAEAVRREEATSELELSRELHVQRASAKAANEEESIALASLQRMEESSLGAVPVDVRSLQREFSRTKGLCRSARENADACRKAAQGLAVALRVAEECLTSEAGLREERSTTVLAKELQGGECVREAAEEMSLLAAAMARAVHQGCQQRADIAKHLALAREGFDGTQSARGAAAASEDELARFAASGTLHDIVSDATMEEQHVQDSVEDGRRRLWSLEQRFEQSEQDAQEALSRREVQLDVAQRKLEQQASALRLVDDQTNTGRYIASELSLELDQHKQEEGIDLSEARALVELISSEEQEAASECSTAQASHDQLARLQKIVKCECVRATELKSGIVHRGEARERALELRRKAEETHVAWSAQTDALRTRRCELHEYSEAISRCRTEEGRLEQTVKVKEQMLTHTRQQIEDIRVAMRRAATAQKEKDGQCHSRLQDLSSTIEEWTEWSTQLQASNEGLEKEVGHLEHAVLRKDETVDFAESQLVGLQALQTEQDTRAATQAKRLRDESRRVLSQAQAAAAEIEEQFRMERSRQIREHNALQAELDEARQRLAVAPGALQAARTRVAEERRRSAGRVVALLAGLADFG